MAIALETNSRGGCPYDKVNNWSSWKDILSSSSIRLEVQIFSEAVFESFIVMRYGRGDVSTTNSFDLGPQGNQDLDPKPLLHLEKLILFKLIWA